jgi:hypothetical protein
MVVTRLIALLCVVLLVGVYGASLFLWRRRFGELGRRARAALGVLAFLVLPLVMEAAHVAVDPGLWHRGRPDQAAPAVVLGAEGGRKAVSVSSPDADRLGFGWRIVTRYASLFVVALCVLVGIWIVDRLRRLRGESGSVLKEPGCACCGGLVIIGSAAIAVVALAGLYDPYNFRRMGESQKRSQIQRAAALAQEFRREVAAARARSLPNDEYWPSPVRQVRVVEVQFREGYEGERPPVLHTYAVEQMEGYLECLGFMIFNERLRQIGAEMMPDAVLGLRVQGKRLSAFYVDADDPDPNRKRKLNTGATLEGELWFQVNEGPRWSQPFSGLKEPPLRLGEGMEDIRARPGGPLHDAFDTGFFEAFAALAMEVFSTRTILHAVMEQCPSEERWRIVPHLEHTSETIAYLTGLVRRESYPATYSVRVLAELKKDGTLKETERAFDAVLVRFLEEGSASDSQPSAALLAVLDPVRAARQVAVLLAEPDGGFDQKAWVLAKHVRRALQGQPESTDNAVQRVREELETAPADRLSAIGRFLAEIEALQTDQR